MYLVGHLIFEAIKKSQADGVGGLTFGADPMAVATSFVSEIQKSPLKAFSIRKEMKNHGISRWIEGDMGGLILSGRTPRPRWKISRKRCSPSGGNIVPFVIP